MIHINPLLLSKSTRNLSNPLKSTASSLDQEIPEILYPPSFFRIFLAGLGLPIPHIVSNVQTERQTELLQEFSHEIPRDDIVLPGREKSCDIQSMIKIETGMCISRFRRLQRALSSFDSLTDPTEFEYRVVYDEREKSWESVTRHLVNLQLLLLKSDPPQLLSSLRLSAGENLLHLAVLLRLYTNPDFSLVRFILLLEPPIMATVFSGSNYANENILHMFAAQGALMPVLELAAMALHPTINGVGLQGIKLPTVDNVNINLKQSSSMSIDLDKTTNSNTMVQPPQLLKQTLSRNKSSSSTAFSMRSQEKFEAKFLYFGSNESSMNTTPLSFSKIPINASTDSYSNSTYLDKLRNLNLLTKHDISQSSTCDTPVKLLQEPQLVRVGTTEKMNETKSPFHMSQHHTFQHQQLQVENQRNAAWEVLYMYEKERSGLGSKYPLLSSVWCCSWLRSAWIGMVNSQTTGTFFSPPPIGTCYYGSTPLSIAAVLGNASLVRFLTVDVGCLDLSKWKSAISFILSKNEESDTFTDVLGPQDHLLLYPSNIKQLGYVELLEQWDPDVCARIDIAEKHNGNNAAHMVILSADDGTNQDHDNEPHGGKGALKMYRLLSQLYSLGYGRWNSSDLYYDKDLIKYREQLLLQRLSLEINEGELFSDQDFENVDEEIGLSKEIDIPPFSCLMNLLGYSETERNLTSNIAPHIFNIRRCQPKFGAPQNKSSSAPVDSTWKTQWQSGPPHASCQRKKALEKLKQNENTDQFNQFNPHLNRRNIIATISQAQDEGLRPVLEMLVNKNGLTTLTLSAHLGRNDLFWSIWVSLSKLLWTWGGVVARAFPIDQIDDIGQIADDHPTLVTSILKADTDRFSKSSQNSNLIRSNTFFGDRLYGESLFFQPSRPFINPIDQDSFEKSIFIQFCSFFSPILFLRWIFGYAPIVENEITSEIRHPTVFEEMVSKNRWNLMAIKGSGGEVSDNEDSSSTFAPGVLLQLIDRKWNRVYGVLFTRRMMWMLLQVSFAWTVFILRSMEKDYLGLFFPNKPALKCTENNSTSMNEKEELKLYSHSTFCFLQRIFIPANAIITGCSLLLLLSSTIGYAAISRLFRFLKSFNSSTNIPPPVRIVWLEGDSSFGIFYITTRILFYLFTFFASIIDIQSGITPGSSIAYAIGGFFGGFHLMYFLVGYKKTGPLVVMFVNAIDKEFVRWGMLFTPFVMFTAFGFFSLTKVSGWERFFGTTSLFAFQTLISPDSSTSLLSTQTDVNEDLIVTITFYILYVLCLVIGLLLVTLLLALVTSSFTRFQDKLTLRWHVERARAMLLIESTLSPWDRLSLPIQYRYFLWLRPDSQIEDEDEDLIGKATSKSLLPARPFFFTQDHSLAMAANGGIYGEKVLDEMLRGR
jgi:hypothetical protein